MTIRSKERFAVSKIVDRTTGKEITTSPYQRQIWKALQRTMDENPNYRLVAFTLQLNSEYKSKLHQLYKTKKIRPASQIQQHLHSHLNEARGVHGMFLVLETEGKHVSGGLQEPMNKPYLKLHVHGVLLVSIETTTKEVVKLFKKAKKMIHTDCPSAVNCVDAYEGQPVSERWMNYIFKNFNNKLNGFDGPDVKRVRKYAASRNLRSTANSICTDEHKLNKHRYHLQKKEDRNLNGKYVGFQEPAANDAHHPQSQKKAMSQKQRD